MGGRRSRSYRGGQSGGNYGNNGRRNSNANGRGNQGSNKHDRNDRYQNYDDDLELSPKERHLISKELKGYWKMGHDLEEIVSEIAEDSRVCPVKWQGQPYNEHKLVEAVTALLKQEGLINYNGAPMPMQWPEALQGQIAQMSLEDLLPDEVQRYLKNDDQYKRTFANWNWDTAAAAIGRFMCTHDMDQVANGTYVPGYDNGVYQNADMPADQTTQDSEEILTQAAGEGWVESVLTARKNTLYDPNYVNRQWAFLQGPPKWGEPSRFVVRQGEPYDPLAKDPAPDPVRPVANAAFYPRKCQGTHGCSRHCAWNRDFRRHDGWSQHLFNNKYGIAMFLQEELDAAIFEDADGDVIMADNFPPWMEVERDESWQGPRVMWTRCLASDMAD